MSSYRNNPPMYIVPCASLNPSDIVYGPDAEGMCGTHNPNSRPPSPTSSSSPSQQSASTSSPSSRSSHRSSRRSAHGRRSLVRHSSKPSAPQFTHVKRSNPKHLASPQAGNEPKTTSKSIHVALVIGACFAVSMYAVLHDK